MGVGSWDRPEIGELYNHRGSIVGGSGGSQGDDLEERARKNNSTLQSLIDAIGAVLAASRELLTRLPGYVPKDDPPSERSPPDADPPREPPADKRSDVPRLMVDAGAPACV